MENALNRSASFLTAVFWVLETPQNTNISRLGHGSQSVPRAARDADGEKETRRTKKKKKSERKKARAPPKRSERKNNYQKMTAVVTKVTVRVRT